jgi:hypothetical protein
MFASRIKVKTMALLLTGASLIAAPVSVAAQSFRPISPYAGVTMSFAFQPDAQIKPKFQAGIGFQSLAAPAQSYVSLYRAAPTRQISYVFDAGFDQKAFININGENIGALQERFLNADEKGGGNGGVALAIVGGVVLVGGLVAVSVQISKDATQCLVNALFLTQCK